MPIINHTTIQIYVFLFIFTIVEALAPQLNMRLDITQSLYSVNIQVFKSGFFNEIFNFTMI